MNNTLAIMQTIQKMVLGLNSGGTQLYKTVALEAVEDWATAWPVCEIHFEDDSSEHFAAGGVISDTQGFRLTTAVNFMQQTPEQAITMLTALRDQIVALFQQHAYLESTAVVADSRVRPGARSLLWVKDGGDYYLVHELIIEVRSQYTVPIGVQGI